MENFSCSTPPRPAAPLPAKLPMEMGTGMHFGKKKLSNRDSPCRRRPWAGRPVLGVRRAKPAPCPCKASPCLSQPPGAPGVPLGKPTMPWGVQGISDSPACLLASTQEPHSAGILSYTGKASNCSPSAPRTCCRSQAHTPPQNGSSQGLRAAEKPSAKGARFYASSAWNS